MGNIISEKYSVIYNTKTATIHCQGTMQLTDEEYEPITQFLDEVVALELSRITLNIQKLEKLNSSGIAMLGMFLSTVSDNQTVELVSQFSKKNWQTKLGKTFQKMMPTLQIEWE
ncbi:MAG TPA: hypothetical protein ENG03_06770 [Thioploca sp.]|nr:MAG: hypothetical protein DRR19_07190 [Gammaproteobacteria bacterium]HDN26789.1 hypothetical protein [Thioploca sp.]